MTHDLWLPGHNSLPILLLQTPSDTIIHIVVSITHIYLEIGICEQITRLGKKIGNILR